MLVFKKKHHSNGPASSKRWQPTPNMYGPVLKGHLQSFQIPQKLSSSPSVALGLHKDAAPHPMLVTAFSNCPSVPHCTSAFPSYENLQTLSSLLHHCCVQPDNLPRKVTLWGQNPPSERPPHMSPVIKMRNPHMLVTICQLVAILPWDMWSHKGVEAIQPLDKQFLAARCSKLPG